MSPTPAPAKRKYRVREGFHLHLDEKYYRGGEFIKMTDAEARGCLHMIEHVEDAAPPAPPSIAPDQRRKR